MECGGDVHPTGSVRRDDVTLGLQQACDRNFMGNDASDRIPDVVCLVPLPVDEHHSDPAQADLHALARALARARARVDDGRADDGHADDGHADDGHAYSSSDRTLARALARALAHADDRHADDRHADDCHADDRHAYFSSDRRADSLPNPQVDPPHCELQSASSEQSTWAVGVPATAANVA